LETVGKNMGLIDWMISLGLLVFIIVAVLRNSKKTKSVTSHFQDDIAPATISWFPAGRYKLFQAGL